MFQIATKEEYDYCISRGYNPLLMQCEVSLSIKLRKKIQNELFGSLLLSRTPKAVENSKFYRYMWKHSKHYCENCLKPLSEYSSTYISHILTRGAFANIAHDPRNINILCCKCHDRWEDSTTRQQMRIYKQNLIRIETLKTEYNECE